MTQDTATQEADRLTKLADEFGLRVEAIHAPFLLVTRRVWGTDPVEKIDRAVHLAGECRGAHGGRPPSLPVARDYRRWNLRGELRGVTEESGIVVAVENMFPLRLPGAPSMRFHSEPRPRRPGTERPTWCSTPVTPRSPSRDIRQALARDHDRIRHIHLSNNAGRGWDSHLPVGRDGVLPVESFLADLTDGYQGSVSLELDLRPWMKVRTRSANCWCSSASTVSGT